MTKKKFKLCAIRKMTVLFLSHQQNFENISQAMWGKIESHIWKNFFLNFVLPGWRSGGKNITGLHHMPVSLILDVAMVGLLKLTC